MSQAPLSLSYRRELDLIGVHGTSTISRSVAAKDPLTTFELAKLCESVAAQAEAESHLGKFDAWLTDHGVSRDAAEKLISRFRDGGFVEQR